jgi:hypothetical protein
MTTHELSDGMKHLGDAISLGAFIGWLVSALPSIATLLTVVWMLIRIFETRTVQRLLGRDAPHE